MSRRFSIAGRHQERDGAAKRLREGPALGCEVVRLHDTRSHRFLPISHKPSSNRTAIYELSAKPSVVSSDGCDLSRAGSVLFGSTWLAYANNISDDCIMASYLNRH